MSNYYFHEAIRKLKEELCPNSKSKVSDIVFPVEVKGMISP